MGFTLRIDTGLYAIDNDTGAETDAARWLSSMPLGERFAVLQPVRKAVYQGQSYDFIKVRRDTGAEGFVIASNAAVGGSLGVVTEERANLYRTPKNVDVLSSTLPFKTLLVYAPETERDGFVEFSAYDPEARTLRSSLFIRKSAFSTRDPDIQASILLQTALSLDPAKDTVRREALLDYPGSVFTGEISALRHPNPSASIAVQRSSVPVLRINDGDGGALLLKPQSGFSLGVLLRKTPARNHGERRRVIGGVRGGLYRPGGELDAGFLPKGRKPAKCSCRAAGTTPPLTCFGNDAPSIRL
jgi:hypothetical protein